MATVVNIKPNDPWAGFGQAFAQSMQQKKELENKKALMDYAQELEQKKYSADAAMLASIPKTQMANQIARKAEEDLTAQQSSDMIDQLLTPGDKLMDMGGAGIAKPDPGTGFPGGSAGASPLVQDDPDSGTPRVTSDQQAQMKVENDLKKKNSEIAAWKAKLAAKGQVVTKDPTTGQMIVTNAKTAADLDMADINKIKGKMQMTQMGIELNEATRKAKEDGVYYTQLLPQRRKDLTKQLMTNASFRSFFPTPKPGEKGDWLDPDKAEAVADGIIHDHPNLSEFLLKVQDNASVYVPSGKRLGSLKQDEFSMVPNKGFIKLDQAIKIEALQLKGTGTGKSTKTVDEKIRNYYTSEKMAPSGNIGPGTPNYINMDYWRAYRGKDEAGITPALAKKAQSVFPISQEGPVYTAGKVLLGGFQQDFQSTVIEGQKLMLNAMRDNPIGVKDDLLVPPEDFGNAAADVFKAEYDLIAQNGAGSKAADRAMEAYKKKLADGTILRRILSDPKIDRANLIPEKKKAPMKPMKTDELIQGVLNLCTKYQLDCTNRSDPKVQSIFQNLEDRRFKTFPDQKKEFYDLWNSMINSAPKVDPARTPTQVPGIPITPGMQKTIDIGTNLGDRVNSSASNLRDKMTIPGTTQLAANYPGGN